MAFAWRFYVEIARVSGTPTSVDVPARSADAAIVQEIRGEDAGVFRIGDQVTGDEIAALGGDTASRLDSAVRAYVQAHLQDYPGFADVLQIRWAKRES